jgi:heme exporter protein B
MKSFNALLVRDIRLSVRLGGGAALVLAFFAMVATLVPLGVGSDLNLLSLIGGGILWVAAILASLLSLDRLFQADFEDGSLDLIVLSPLSLEAMITAKATAHFLTTGLPLAVISPLLGLLFGIPSENFGLLFLSLLIGTPAISGLGAVGAGLTLGIRRGGLILPFILLPLLSPLVVFGAAAFVPDAGGSAQASLLLLAAFSLFTTALSPFVAAAAVRLNLAG